jgi:AcrR family transcriptional regulator
VRHVGAGREQSHDGDGEGANDFLDKGEPGRRVRAAIAAAAGVAVQTVYAAFGSKQGILLALLDEMAADADLARMQAAVAAAFTCRFYAAGADLIEIGRTVSGIEPDLRAFWEEGEGRRYRATAALISEWSRAGMLAPGMTAKQATDIMWALGGPDVFRLFTRERRWSKRRFEAWLGATLEAQLFGSSKPLRGAAPANRTS